MNTAHPAFTVADYFALEAASEERYEWREGEAVCVSGSDHQHNTIAVNLAALLRGHLRGSLCRPFLLTIRVQIERGRCYVYPDLVVTCGKARYAPDVPLDTLENPTVVVEVVSPSTEAFDRGRKFAYYRAIPSLRAYLLVSKTEARVDLFERAEEDLWRISSAAGLDATLHIVTLDVELHLRDLYDDVDLPPPPEPEDGLVAAPGERR